MKRCFFLHLVGRRKLNTNSLLGVGFHYLPSQCRYEEGKKRRQWKQIASARTISNERIIRPEKPRVPLLLHALLSAANVSTKARPPCVRIRAIVGHYIYVIMEWMKVLFIAPPRIPFFRLRRRHRRVFFLFTEKYSSSPKLSTSSALVPRLLVCRKYSYQQLMLFAICTNIYIKRTTRREKTSNYVFLLSHFIEMSSRSESLDVERLWNFSKDKKANKRSDARVWRKHVFASGNQGVDEKVFSGKNLNFGFPI